MKKNKNLKFWTADISVRRGIRRYFMTGGLYNGKRYFEFKKEDDFMDFLLKIKRVVFFQILFLFFEANRV